MTRKKQLNKLIIQSLAPTKLEQYLSAAPPTAPIQILHTSSGAGVSTSIRPSRLELLETERNAQLHARLNNPQVTNPTNPPNAAFGIADADNYEDAVSDYGDVFSQVVTQRTALSDEKREKMRLETQAHLATLAQQALPIAHNRATEQLHGMTITVPSDPIAYDITQLNAAAAARKRSSSPGANRHTTSHSPEKGESETPARRATLSGRRQRKKQRAHYKRLC